MRFPDDYFIEALRSTPRPSPSKVRGNTARMMAFLQRKAQQRMLGGDKKGMNLTIQDMAVLAVLIEVYEQHPKKETP